MSPERRKAKMVNAAERTQRRRLERNVQALGARPVGWQLEVLAQSLRSRGGLVEWDKTRQNRPHPTLARYFDGRPW